MKATKTQKPRPPTLMEVLSRPPGTKEQQDEFYDFQDMIGIHWFKRPPENQKKQAAEK